MKKNNSVLILSLVIIGVFALSYSSYKLGHDMSENDLGPLMMVMNIDSTFVTTGIFETMPNNVKRAIQFYIEDTPTVVKDVKIFAEVKFATVEGKQVNFDNGKIWNLIKSERVFQRQLPTKQRENEKKSDKNKKKEFTPGGNVTQVYKTN